MWVYKCWPFGTMWGGSVTARLWSRQAQAYWGWQTEPDWAPGHFPLDTFDVCSSLLADSWCLSKSSPIPHYTDKTTHIWRNVLPGLSFLKNATHLSIPQSIWTPLNLGNPTMNAVCMCFCCVALSLGTVESLCKLIPKSQYLLKKFTCAQLCSINAIEINLHSSSVTRNSCNSKYLLAWTVSHRHFIFGTHLDTYTRLDERRLMID